MAKDMFDISDDAWGMPQEAVREFTDREDPQEAFERKIRVLNENWKKSFYVLCYYGMGGIGKTSFVNKLCRVIRGVEGNELRLLDKIDCNYIRYDFDAKTSGIDKLSILLSLRKQLGEADKNFKFFRFDSAVLLYAKKSGSSVEKDQTAQSLLEGNPWLDAVMSTVGTIPVVGWVSGVFQAIDKSAKTVKEAIGKHVDEAKYRSHLNEIDGMEMPELLGKLHEYFILDMRYNMQQIATKPMIVFLDTFERYIDTLNREISMITEDYWLRKGNKSVIRSVPGMLWVITGQDKLYWAEDDAWDEPEAERPLSEMSEEEKEELAQRHLEQHLLGALSEKDATVFLKKAGIANDTLCTQLYKLTNGTPLFLDICVDTYYELCNKGVQPEIDLFGKDKKQLSNRYLLNLNDANREMAYFLACLGKWNDESVQRIAKEATTLRWYTHAKYENFAKHSFIIKNLDGSYYMHETVRCAALENADKEIVEEIKRINLSVIKERIEQADIILDTSLIDYVAILVEQTCAYKDFYNHLKVIRRKMNLLKSYGENDLIYSVNKLLYQTAVNLYPNSGVQMIIKTEYAESLCLKGLLTEALTIISEINLEVKYEDIDLTDYLSVQLLAGKIYYANSEFEKGLMITEDVFEMSANMLGKKHPDTLRAEHAISLFYYDLGRTEKAIELCEQVLNLRKELFGVNHPETLEVMNSLSCYYAGINRYEPALELKKQALSVSITLFGNEHSNTLMMMKSLSEFYSYIGRMADAKALYERLHGLTKTRYGENAIETVTVLFELANIYNYMGDPRKAYDVCRQVFDIRMKVYGLEHPQTKQVASAMKRICIQLGDVKKAKELLSLDAMYDQGRGVAKDSEKALEWYRKARDQGSKGAVSELSKLYENFEEQMPPHKMFSLGVMYYYGRGVEQNYEIAFEWFQKAAKRDNSDAQYYLGIMYYFALGTSKNIDKALEMLQASARLGNVNAKTKLKQFFNK